MEFLPSDPEMMHICINVFEWIPSYLFAKIIWLTSTKVFRFFNWPFDPNCILKKLYCIIHYCEWIIDDTCLVHYVLWHFVYVFITNITRQGSSLIHSARHACSEEGVFCLKCKYTVGRPSGSKILDYVPLHHFLARKNSRGNINIDKYSIIDPFNLPAGTAYSDHYFLP